MQSIFFLVKTQFPICGTNAVALGTSAPEGVKYGCAGHVSSLMGAGRRSSKSLKSRDGRNLVAESKGVRREAGSEGS